MATDVDVQYFSHLNGLTLGNNWGDLIRLLDKTLVTGLDFTQITAASIDTQGDVHITLYSAHNAMLLQVVELSGFAPASLNQKYRIKGVPSSTELILKPHTAITATNIVTIGSAKLASLGYEIVFRDTNDVKRVYRAKNPTAQHPFIRIDESIASDTGSYASTYAKSAMVGLLEHMDHIDDYENPDVLQLPFDPSDPAKNWKITGTGTSVVRGWSKWHYAKSNAHYNVPADSNAPSAGGRAFTLAGDRDAFYFMRGFVSTVAGNNSKLLSGCGLFRSSLKTDIIPNWFLISHHLQSAASAGYSITGQGFNPLGLSATASTFLSTTHNELERLQNSVIASPIMPDYSSGFSGIYSSNNLSALEIPFFDEHKYLRGTLKHINYVGNNKSSDEPVTTPVISDQSMYVSDKYQAANTASAYGALIFYLGEIE